jgi:hypothetical protein
VKKGFNRLFPDPYYVGGIGKGFGEVDVKTARGEAGDAGEEEGGVAAEGGEEKEGGAGEAEDEGKPRKREAEEHRRNMLAAKWVLDLLEEEDEEGLANLDLMPIVSFWCQTFLKHDGLLSLGGKELSGWDVRETGRRTRHAPHRIRKEGEFWNAER